MIRRCFAMLVCLFGVLFVTVGCVFTRSDSDLKALGLEYRLKELKEPRPNRVHVLRVDLSSKKIKLDVVIAPDPDGAGPAEATLTDPLKLASTGSVVAFVNTNPWDSFVNSSGKKNRRWFEGQAVDIHGLAVSRGQIRSLAWQNDASVWTNTQGQIFWGDAWGHKSFAQAVAGFQQIVRKGVVVISPGGAVHPRTAIGVDKKGRVMILVVVDGRQKQYSEGMNLYELGHLMLDLGCWNATNMDGGGSSIMGLAGPDGQLGIVSSPSDRKNGVPEIRPLPMILTIRRP